jgi:hypothetical protein
MGSQTNSTALTLRLFILDCIPRVVHLIGNYGSTLLPDGLHFFHHLLTYFTVLMLIIACTSFPLKTVSSSFSNITCELAKLFGCRVPKSGNRLAADKCPHSKEKQDDTTDGRHD